MKNQEYSGQFRVRLPKSLHAWLRAEAKKEGISMNTYLLLLIEHARSCNDSEKIVYEYERNKKALRHGQRTEPF